VAANRDQAHRSASSEDEWHLNITRKRNGFAHIRRRLNLR
jgi:hypothetical protein